MERDRAEFDNETYFRIEGKWAGGERGVQKEVKLVVFPEKMSKRKSSPPCVGRSRALSTSINEMILYMGAFLVFEIGISIKRGEDRLLFFLPGE